MARVDGQGCIRIKDEGRKSALYEARSEQAIAPVDALNDLLAD